MPDGLRDTALGMKKNALALVAAVALAGIAGYYVFTHLRSEPVCEACQRAIHGETHYRVHLTDGSVEHVCCPRCGLRFQRDRDDVAFVEASDFYTRKPIDGKTALYVEDSTVVMCRHDERVLEDRSGVQYQLTWDRCLPSLIAFETRAGAVRFQNESGGIIKTYDELLAEPF